ncbi:polyketide-type polyunsaturated fatty acid synthase PfaA [Chitinophaga sp. YR573]|uniref:type I polyketide synthase n=1 Tax=Chitinophaga sp. YR573 TaxID=1881040 RepID=UPI0008B2E41A|nr:type I polyketide synthase [Chitinophaga sp. YR573]SEW00666.1 polyketide-type polyunsaturated fatty acid synthase PfaA [Chitinophaga sp. YR573]
MNKPIGIEKDIAVVGMSSLFAKAKNLDEYWQNIVEEINCITEVPENRWKISDYYSSNPTDPDKSYSKVGGFIPDINFNPMEFGLPPNILELTDSSQLLSLVVAKAALEDAGYWQNEKFNKEVRQRTGVVLGVGGGQKLLGTLISRLQYPIWEKTLRAYGIPEKDLTVVIEHIKSAFVKWEENSFPGLLGNVIAGRITNRFDLGGTNCVVDAACATSLSAIKMAVMELQLGHVDMIITGGVDTDTSPVMYLSFSKTPAFSKENQIRPFDDKSDGIVIGEGIGLVVLKRLSDAVRDGDKIYSVIKGIGSSSDGKNKSIYAPQSSGQSLALKRTYEQAGYSMNTIGLIECHGTGTPTGDPSEFDSLKIEMAHQPSEKQSIALSSVKSQIGHTKSTAGAAGFIKASLALYNKILPGTINVTMPNRKFDIENTPFYINTFTRPWINPLHTPRRASVSAFGFGGTNFHVTLEEYQSEHTKPYRSYTSSYAVVLTADTKNELIHNAGQLLEQLNAPNANEILADISDNALKIKLKGDQPKLGFVAVDVQEAISTLSAAIQYISSTAKPLFEHPKGFYYSEDDLVKGGKTAALFSGQGSQYVNMSNDMTCFFPPFREVLGKLDELFVKSGEKALSKVVYPIPAFNEETKAQQKQELTQTQYAQPAIGAISMAYYKLLKQSGFSPDMVAGHSFGELTALWASGALTEEDYLLLAKERGRFMGTNTSEERGAMLAVSAELKRVKEIITNFEKLVVANINSDNQIVLGGDTKEIETALAEFQRLGISAVKLPVSAAFHTSFVEHAAGSFSAIVAKTKFKAPETPVYSNTSAAKYTETVEAIKATLSSHILKPVLFKDEIEQMYKDNARVFVEFGPKGILTNLVKKILNGREFIAIAINPSEEKGSEYQFKDAVIKMKIAGLPVTEPDVFKIPAQKNIVADKLNVVLSSANYQSEATIKYYNEGLEKVKKLKAAAETEYTPEIANSQQPVKAAAVSIGDTGPETNAFYSDIFLKQLEGFKAISQLMAEQVKLLESLHPKYAITDKHIESKPKLLIPEQQPPASSTTISVTPNELINSLMNVVSDKTGYPTEMLELSMDMEADLGIDSIKRVEIFGAMQQAFPTVTGANLKEMAALKTLGQIADYLETKMGMTSIVTPTPAPATATQTTTVTSGADLNTVVQSLLQVVSDKTGYPIEMLELSMDMEADLGIDSIKRVEIFGAMQQAFPTIIGANLKEMAALKTLGQIADYLETKMGIASVAAPASATPTVISGADINTLIQSLLQVVSDKTGYPTEMLELSMDMEADLGIDSIKRVEIFGAMQQAFPTMTGANLKEMAALKTLGQIADYLEAKSNGTVRENSFSSEVKKSAPEKKILTDYKVKRSEPRLKFLPRPDKLVIEWSKNDTVIITDNGSKLLTDLVDNLLNLSVNVILLHLPESLGKKVPDTKPGKATHVSLSSVSDEAIKQAFDETAQKYNTITGVICTFENHDASSLNTIINDQLYLKAAFFIAKHFKLRLNKQDITGARPFFISVSQIDGYLGFNNNSNLSLIQGGNCGLIKTIGLEWPDVFCRSIDIRPGMDTQVAASLIMGELLDPNMETKEVALTENTRNTIVAEEIAPDPDSLHHLTVTSGDVFLVTGGGRGITSTCINKLGQYCKPKFILLGRSSVNLPEPAWAKGETDEKELKKKIAGQLKNEGKNPTPAEVQKIFQQIISKREIEQTLAELKANGSEAIYFQADVRDKKQLEQIVKETRLKMGEITGIIHGAGVLADKLIEQKSEEDFEQVFSVKVGGLLSVLEVLPPEKLKFLLLFSSVAGFYGNQGQADYALSNEILNKLALYIAARYRQCKTVSYNWGPWDAGMVSPELKRSFEERNVSIIPPDYGAQLFVSELSSTYTGNTLVIVGSPLPLPPTQIKPRLRKYTIERKLKLEDNPFLNDHVISGNAVLPALNAIGMIIDGTRQFYPGLKVAAVEDSRVLKGIVFDDKFSENFALELTELEKDNDEVLFEGTLYSQTKTGKKLMHYKTRVLLSRYLKPSTVIPVENIDKPGMIKGEVLYENGTLFHGPSFKGITEVLKIDNNELIVKCLIKPVNEEIQGQFPVSDTNAFIMDVKFQGMVVWAKHLFNSASLPVKVIKCEFFKPLQFNTEYFVMYKIRSANGVIMSADICSCDKDGNICVVLIGAEIVLSKELNEAFANKKYTVAL